jgi:hypothetical protein
MLLLLVGAVLIVTGLGLGTWLSTKTAVVCSHADGAAATCAVERRLFGTVIWRRPLVGLSGARLDQKVDSEGDTLYRVVLLTDEGAVPLTLAWSSGYGSKAELVSQVNAYLGQRASSDLDASSGESAGLIVLAVCVPLGLVVAFFGAVALRTTWVIDRSRQVLVRQVARLRGVRVTEYDLEDVVDVRIARSSGDDGDTYRIVVWLSSGEGVPMTSFYTSGYSRKAQTVAAMREFLGLDAAAADGDAE